MSYINLLANDVWSESDITNRGRAIIDSQVTEARQNELRTIMLGHIAQMRVASPEELGEIMQVAALTEQAAVDNALARADMALLTAVIAHEAALAGTEEYPEPTAEVLALYALRNPVVEPVEEEVLDPVEVAE